MKHLLTALMLAVLGLAATAPARAQTARIQFVNATPDPTVGTVGLWVNGTQIGGDLTFEHATAFLDTPSGEVEVVLRASDGSTLLTRTLDFTENRSYYLVVSGVVDSASFPSNPETGVDTSLSISLAEANEVSAVSGQFEIRMFHAAVDCPRLDWWTWGGGLSPFRVWRDVGFGEFSAVTHGSPGRYTGEARQVGGATRLGTEDIGDFSDRGGQSFINVFTGWLTASQGRELNMVEVYADGSVVGTASQPIGTLPSTYDLETNYPNPFNPSTMIRFSTPQTGTVRLAVYDLLGREVRVLVDGLVNAGDHEVRFDAKDLPSGTYLYRLETGSGSLARQMLLVR
jgi:uncharacterized protein DUF4397/type IX secretion system substrate protein